MDYLIRVKTANVICAGTDRDVYIVMVGESGKESPKFEMTERIPGNALERNADEKFTVKCDDIGRIVKIKLSKDKTDDWECEFIEITRTEVARSPESVFHVNACITGSHTKEFIVS